MTWTNAFDVGPCTVKVIVYDASFQPQIVWEGLLGKGQTQVIADLLAGFTPPGGSVSVDADGYVILSCDNGTPYSREGFEVHVIPSYQVTHKPHLGDTGSDLGSPITMTAGINSLVPGVDGVDYATLIGAPPIGDIDDLTGISDRIWVFVANVPV